MNSIAAMTLSRQFKQIDLKILGSHAHDKLRVGRGRGLVFERGQISLNYFASPRSRIMEVQG